MTIRSSDDKQHHVLLSGGVMCVHWHAGEVNEETVTAVTSRVAELSAGGVYPVLFNLQGIRKVTYRGRKALAAGPWTQTPVAIVAVSPVDRAAAYFFLGRHPPACTTRLFASRSEAMTWLRETDGTEEDLSSLHGEPG